VAGAFQLAEPRGQIAAHAGVKRVRLAVRHPDHGHSALRLDADHG
jgi:hypothetical protein